MVGNWRMLQNKYLGTVLDESGTNGEECCRKVRRGSKVTDIIRLFVNVRNL